MKNIIEEIINYIPFNDYGEMINAKIYTFVRKNDYDYNLNYTENEPSRFDISLEENLINKIKIKKSNDPSDILIDILNTFEKFFRINKNNKYIDFDNNKINKNDYLNSRIYLASTVLRTENKMGNIIGLIPEKVYDLINVNSSLLNKKILNTIDNKIYIIYKCNETYNQKYHLLVTPNIPSDRSLKINKLLGKNIYFNYYIMPNVNSMYSVIIYDLD